MRSRRDDRDGIERRSPLIHEIPRMTEANQQRETARSANLEQMNHSMSGVRGWSKDEARESRCGRP
jgi:hypothetical protein